MVNALRMFAVICDLVLSLGCIAYVMSDDAMDGRLRRTDMVVAAICIMNILAIMVVR